MLPEAFLERMRQMLGEEFPAFVASYDMEKFQALRLNRLKINLDGKDATELLTQESPFGLRPVPWARDGFFYEKEAQPGKHPFHSAGVYYIQEPSAMAPAGFLDVMPREKVLDLCAAPGGKSTQLAAMMEGRGLLVCNEIHPARAKILSENVERMGISNAIVTNETPANLAEHFLGFFDKILVDAPCSGEGMFRKNEEACDEWSLENVENCAARQDEILDCAARMLAAGGRLVYSTCTFAPAENEGSISRFLDRHPEFSLIPIEKDDFGEGCDGKQEFLAGAVEGIGKTLRLWPHRIHGEGHFAALLQKAGVHETAGDLECMESVGKDLAPYQDFVKETLLSNNLRECLQGDVRGGKFLKFGDNLYLAPHLAPDLNGMKVLRPGLHLGEMKKGRFEPSHALALALRPDKAKHVFDMQADDPKVLAYLNGQTFPAEGEKGWYLICVGGFSIGWGKLAGGIMKNHYPKGLRVNL